MIQAGEAKEDEAEDVAELRGWRQGQDKHKAPAPLLPAHCPYRKKGTSPKTCL